MIQDKIADFYYFLNIITASLLTYISHVFLHTCIKVSSTWGRGLHFHKGWLTHARSPADLTQINMVWVRWAMVKVQ